MTMPAAMTSYRSEGSVSFPSALLLNGSFNATLVPDTIFVTAWRTVFKAFDPTVSAALSAP
jgi:hypothetical protein